MRVVVKILILLLAVILAVGGIMIYAKTKVEPPVESKTFDQFADDLQKSKEAIIKGEGIYKKYDSYSLGIEKIKIFQQEGKISSATADISLENAASNFASLFMQFCHEEFKWPSCGSENHEWMLSRINELNNFRRTDGTKGLSKTTSDSLEHVNRIIADYKRAYSISRKNRFTNLSDARSTINQAAKYANDRYLSICSDLVTALNSVKGNLAKSHYDAVSSQVDELSQYRFLGEQFYLNTLMPQVRQAVTEYDREAAALYGTKSGVDLLWNRLRDYDNQARTHYQTRN